MAVAVAVAAMAAATEAAMVVVEAAAEAEVSVADDAALPNKQEPAHAGSFHGERWMDGILGVLICKAKQRSRAQSRTNKVTKGSGPT